MTNDNPDERPDDETRLFKLVEAHLSDTEPPFDTEAGLAELRRRLRQLDPHQLEPLRKWITQQNSQDLADEMEHLLGPVTDDETAALREQWPPD